MKYFILPAAVLALLLGAALWNASAVDAAVAPWCAALTEAQESAARSDWDGAARVVRETRRAWDAHRVHYHVVAAHDELEAADTLFAAAESYAAERDAAEFRACAAQLIVRLRVVAEMQQMTLKNIL